MMLELDDYDYELLKEVEKSNLTNYEIIDIQNKHYIDPDTLLSIIEDTQENREYAEKKLKELADSIDGR